MKMVVIALVALLMMAAGPPPDDLLAGPQVGDRTQESAPTSQPAATPDNTPVTLTPKIVRRPVEEDPALIAIAAIVQPEPEMMQKIVERFKRMRAEQQAASRRVIRRYMSQGVRPDNQEARDAANTEIAQMRLAEVESFMVEVNQMLTPEQRIGWNDAQVYLNFMPEPPVRTLENLRDSPRAWMLGPEVGARAFMFVLADTAGKQTRLEDVLGKATVLEFGSMSSPVFRSRLYDRAALKQAFGDDLTWVIVHTPEARSTADPVSQQNRRDSIRIARHETIEERRAAASALQETVGTGATVLVDGMDNAITTLYAGFPNRAYVMDRSGLVVSKQLWFDPEQTRTAVESILNPRPAATSRPAAD